MKKEYIAKAAEKVGKRIDIAISSKSISIDEDKHRATFVMSTSAVDRHGDIVDQESWKLEHFQENPAFFWGHRSNEFPLGKWVSVGLEQDPNLPGKMRLVGTAEFAVEVDEEIKRAWAHVVRGDLNMVSVGFIPHIVDYDEERDAFVLKSCELMECSLVGIGANRGALIKSQEQVTQDLIDTKDTLGAIPGLGAIQKRNATLLINKAVRQLQK